MSSDNFKIMEYLFGGVVANLPLWLLTLLATGMDPSSPITLGSIAISAITGGTLAGYLIRARSLNDYKWAPVITGLLAFFASILIAESLIGNYTDLILLPSFLVGTYSGKKIGESRRLKDETQQAPRKETESSNT